MMNVKRLTCLWPGLARLWFRGDWSGLLIACVYAVLINGLIVTTLLWTEVAPISLRWAGLVFATVWWLCAVVWSLRSLPDIASSNLDDPNQGLFVAAQTEYLKGNWIEAEACVRKLLRKMPRDVESLLLLATIQRRTRRFDEARGQLQQIARLDGAGDWQVELRKEREMLRRETQRERMEQIHNVQPSPFSSRLEISSNNQQDDPSNENEPSDTSPSEQLPPANSETGQPTNRRAA